MSETEEEIWRSAEPLSEAWLTYCDYGTPGWDRAAELKFLYRGGEKNTKASIEAHVDRAERLEAGLKKEFLWRIHDGEFRALGRDITSRISAPVEFIVGAFFGRYDDEFEIDWYRSEIKALGRHIVEIRVVPDKTRAEREPEKSEPKRKLGRPESDKIAPALEQVVCDMPDFWELTRSRQCDLVRVQIFGPEVDNTKPPKGYTDSAIKKRLRGANPS